MVTRTATKLNSCYLIIDNNNYYYKQFYYNIRACIQNYCHMNCWMRE